MGRGLEVKKGDKAEKLENRRRTLVQPVSAIRGEGAVRVREAADKEERELEDGMKAGGSGGAGVRGSEKGLGKRVV